MTKYLLDTNIIVRFSNPDDDRHQLVSEAVATLLMRSDECCLTAQVLIEFWVVATRPIDVNGLGWSAEQTYNTIAQLLNRFPMLEEKTSVFMIWLNLVTQNQVKGKRTHDIRLVAVMLASGIDHILTLNPSDFAGMSGITIVRPQAIVNTQT